ncbi:MAG: hypothetical protein IJ542_01450 [Clostridia bacterium]|nr:hypothetical protein [Clostridia bacterium]
MIISGIGIDFDGTNYQITAQAVLPSSNSKESGINAQVDHVSASAETISQAMSEISNKFGKNAELSHTEFILLGNQIENKNIVGELDFFFRNFKLKNSIMLLTCEKSAKETIEKIGKLDMGVALSLQKIFISEEENMHSLNKSYVEFVIDSFKPSATSQIDTLEFEDTEENESKEKQSKAKLKLNTPIKLFKNGVFTSKIEDKEMINAFYLCNKKSRSGNIQLKNFSFGDAINANINLRIDNIKTKKYVTFGDNPTLHVDIKIVEASIDEISTKGMNKNLYRSVIQKDLQQAIINAAQEKITNGIYELFNYTKSINYDIFGVENLASMFNLDEWNNYIQKLDGKSKLLENVSIDISVEFDKFR